ncbi:MAG: hypothetical protein NTY40_04375 [Synechococcus sp. LacPavin_0920_WC12_MAG_50_7]|nr:hypothetical protein [Synechococcus sp. LacPavin_0920_WC12_MAG_50_7]
MSFEAAMEAAALWCGTWEQGDLSDEVLADKVAQLLTSRDGARGFFVVSLPAENPLMDRLPEPLLIALMAAGEEVVDLTARNLAMSTAMAVYHRRVGAEDQCLGLLAATDGIGSDVAFLDRWQYDAEQKAAIKAAVLSVAD